MRKMIALTLALAFAAASSASFAKVPDNGQQGQKMEKGHKKK